MTPLAEMVEAWRSPPMLSINEPEVRWLEPVS